MTPRSHLIPVLAAALLLSPPQLSILQAQQINDPANLTGERVSPQSPADTLAINRGAPALQQLLLKLRTRASMMLIVAHPDDEDGGFLTFESRGQGARVALLTLTRGEGGQNLMTADFDDALGLIRTQELLAADRYMGVDQFFGTEIDFGFSKTREEAFARWTHDRVLYDAVRAVRLYRPLVLASVFVGGPTDGHGHHQVSGEISQEVFTAAADPNVFPEMIQQGLLPWAPLKVYARVPFAPVTAQGMFDYATGRTIPTRFQNYVTGQVSTSVPTPTVVIHEGDPALIAFPGHPAAPALGMEGLSYVQFARKGLALQKTQIGPNVRLPAPGRNDSGYTLIASRLCQTPGCPILSGTIGKGGVSGEGPTALPSQTPPSQEQSIFDNIDTSIQSIAPLEPDAPAVLTIGFRNLLNYIDGQIAEAQKAFSPQNIGTCAPFLREALKSLDSLINNLQSSGPAILPEIQRFNDLHELRVKQVQLNDALVLALGLTLTAHTQSMPDGWLLTSTPTRAELTITGLHPTHLHDITVTSPTGTLQQLFPNPRFADSPTITLESALVLPDDTPLTRPYFSHPDAEQPFYTLTDQTLRNAPATPAPLTAIAHFDYEGLPLELRQTFTPAAANNPVSVVPRFSVSISPAVGIDATSRPKNLPIPLAVAVTSLAQNSGSLRLEAPAHWTSTPSRATLDSLPAGTRKVFNFAVTPAPVSPSVIANDGHYRLTAIAQSGPNRYSESFRPVGYPGLTYTNLYTPATYRATAVDVTTAPNLRVAYLPGTGDSVPDFLPNLGITPTLITPADLNPTSLAKFDTVLLGVRAYSAHPDLNSAALHSFAANGGTVILQYLSGGAPATVYPYPLNLPGDPAHNVVEEAQPVTLLAPQSPILNWPNKITAADFNNWLEERGHGFAATWDPHFQPLLETHDVDQDPQKGGLLLAPVGKGAYIYCALALYRQLPEGVPGAYRLLANLLSYPKNPKAKNP